MNAKWHIHAAALCTCLAMAQSSLAQTRDVVVVGGALTEIVYALGAEQRIAGTDTTSLFPDAAQKTPKVGYQRTLNAEGLLALRPSLLLAAGEAGPPAAIEQIKAAGVKVEQMPVEFTMAGVIDRVKRISTSLNMQKEGEALARKLNGDWDVVRARVAAYRKSGTAKPRVLFILAHSAAPQVAGSDTAAHAMIELAGGENVMKAFTGYKPLTAEGAATAAPDIILITDQGLAAQGGIDGLLAKPGLALTPAGSKRRIVSLDALELLGFGPRVPQTVSTLADRFYSKP